MILRSHFYYGSFEYPAGSGQWYQGKHQPLINKALFDQVQEKIVVQITKGDSKEFAFTKLLSCGLCGSSITADEKFKNQKNGNIHRYVYYGCTKHNDKRCKSGYINEDNLLEQLINLMDQIDLDSIGMKERIKTEIDIRNYAKYILREGQLYEKRELLGCLRSKLKLANKIITL